MDNYCSPQWVDFTSTPDVPSDDYFEKNHEIYEHKGSMKVPEIKTTSEDKENIKKNSETKINDEKLETELNIIKNTPIKVIYSPATLRSSKKYKLNKKITYDDIVHEAIENFDYCTSVKLDIFKKPMQIKNGVSESLKFHEADSNPVDVLSNIKVEQAIGDKPDQEIESLSSTNSCNPVAYTPVNCMKSLRVNIPSKQEQRVLSDKKSSNKRSKPVTYQCRRQSLIFRRRSNPFISLAAAVHKFQNETPERFHIKCNKNLKVKAASAKRDSSVTKSIFAKSNMKRRSVPNFRQKGEKDSELEKMKELSCKNTARNKHIVSTIIKNNSSEIVIKKEKILFFDIPIHTKQKATTRPVPFSFEYRDKAKKESKSKQLQLEDNKSVNNLKPQNAETRILPKKIRTGLIGTQNIAPPSINEKSKNNEKNVVSNKSRSMSSLKSYNKTEDKNEETGHFHSKDTERLKKQSTSMAFKNSFDKNKHTAHNTQTKNINQVNKQSSSVFCKEKSKTGNKKIEAIQTKEDPNKMKRKCTSNNSINTNTDTQENKCPINPSTSSENVNPTKNMKPKSSTIGMNSYERGKQRHEYDEKVREKIKMQEENRRKMEEVKLAQEKLQVAMFRKKLEVKARPVPAYKPLIPTKSTKPLTEPQSPAWAYKKTKKST